MEAAAWGMVLRARSRDSMLAKMVAALVRLLAIRIDHGSHYRWPEYARIVACQFVAPRCSPRP